MTEMSWRCSSLGKVTIKHASAAKDLLTTAEELLELALPWWSARWWYKVACQVNPHSLII
jgi:hypothetical protein